jgi:uncharacterized repeat protein (TIGR03803 family)
MPSKNFYGRLVRGLAICVAVALMTSAASAATEKVLYGFTGGNDGGNPTSGLIFDNTGNAYGTTSVGGAFGFGSVFKLTRDQNGNFTESVLYSFTGGGDGKNPFGGVVIDRAGNLYGTTAAGGFGGACTGDGCGVVFKLTRDQNGNFSQNVIYSFTGGNDGFGPGAPLIFDNRGVLYGMTPDGGEFAQGTVFELLPSASGNWGFKTIHSFTGGDDGAVGSLGPLLSDGMGNLYGVTEIGGANGVGTVFEMTPAGNGEFNLTTLYAFKGQPDAGFPFGGVIFDSMGNLYGTTFFGGTNGVGTVYKLTPTMNGWQESVLYSFKGGRDGSLTTTTPVFNASGNLYGTTSTGGKVSCDCGTVFKLALVNGKWQESVVYRFQSAPDGSSPFYGLTPDSAGNLYSTTAVGGPQNQGTVFRITP